MINSKIMRAFLEKAISKLSGDWIIIGGTVLPLVGIDVRVTVDIDIINLNFESSNKDSIKLMEIAEELKLPVESINQAGAYYLSKIDDIHEHLVLLQESKNCRVYRPDTYLFIKLKVERLSETDLQDCLHFVQKHEEECNSMKKNIVKLINQKMKDSSDPIKKRLQDLKELIEK